MLLRLTSFVLLASALLLGCSGGGGHQGDVNDPATTSDQAQMSRETGDVGAGDEAKKK